MSKELVSEQRAVTLLDLLDRMLHKGVVLWGETVISVANVDLIYLGLKVFLSSVETAEKMRRSGWDTRLEEDVAGHAIPVRHHRSA